MLDGNFGYESDDERFSSINNVFYLNKLHALHYIFLVTFGLPSIGMQSIL